MLTNIRPSSLRLHNRTFAFFAGILWAAAIISVVPCQGAFPLFEDDFASGASPLWEDNVGSWSAAGGEYNATAPSGFPNAFSALPFVLTDFSIDVDVLAVGDGGIWLRSAPAVGTIGINGVLLVTGGADPTSLYWHVVTDGNAYGSILSQATGLFAAGGSPHIRVEVSGNTYSAFVNGSLTAATTLTDSSFSSGRVALYDNSAQSFDNVSVVPEPSSLLLLGIGLSFVIGRRKRVLVSGSR